MENGRQDHLFHQESEKEDISKHRRDYDHREFAFQNHPRLKKKRLSTLIHPDTLEEDYNFERRGTVEFSSGLLGAGRSRRTSRVKTGGVTSQMKVNKPLKRRKKGSLDDDIRRPLREDEDEDVFDSNENDEEAIQNIMVHLEEKQKQRKQQKYGEDLAGIKERMAELLKEYPEEDEDVFDVSKLADPDFFISKETKEKNVTQIEINKILEQYLEVCCDRTDLLSNVEDALNFDEFQRNLKSPELENLDNMSSEISITIEMIAQSSGKLNRLYNKLHRLYESKAINFVGGVEPKKTKVDLQKQVINKFKSLQLQGLKRKEKADTWKYAADEIVDLLKTVRQEGSGDQEKLEMELHKLLTAFTTQTKTLEDYQETITLQRSTILKSEAMKEKLKNDNSLLQDEFDRTRVQAKSIQMKYTKLESELKSAQEKLMELQNSQVKADADAEESDTENYLKALPSYYVQNQNMEHEIERLEALLKTERLKNREMIAERKKISLGLASGSPTLTNVTTQNAVENNPPIAQEFNGTESFESRMALRKCLKCSSYKERIDDLTKDISNKRDKIARLTTQLESAVSAESAKGSINVSRSSAKEVIEQYLKTSFDNVAPPSTPEIENRRTSSSSSRTVRTSAKQIIVYQEIEIEDVIQRPDVVDESTQTDDIPIPTAIGIERQRSTVPTQDIIAKNQATLVEEDFHDMATRIYSYVTTIGDFDKIMENVMNKSRESVLSPITQSKEELSPASSTTSVVETMFSDYQLIEDKPKKFDKPVASSQEKKKKTSIQVGSEEQNVEQSSSATKHSNIQDENVPDEEDAGEAYGSDGEHTTKPPATKEAKVFDDIEQASVPDGKKIGVSGGKQASVSSDGKKIGVSGGKQASVSSDGKNISVSGGKQASVPSDGKKIGVSGGKQASVSSDGKNISVSGGKQASVSDGKKISVSGGKQASVSSNGKNISVSGGKQASVPSDGKKISISGGKTISVSSGGKKISVSGGQQASVPSDGKKIIISGGKTISVSSGGKKISVSGGQQSSVPSDGKQASDSDVKEATTTNKNEKRRSGLQTVTQNQMLVSESNNEYEEDDDVCSDAIVEEPIIEEPIVEEQFEAPLSNEHLSDSTLKKKIGGKEETRPQSGKPAQSSIQQSKVVPEMNSPKKPNKSQPLQQPERNQISSQQKPRETMKGSTTNDKNVSEMAISKEEQKQAKRVFSNNKKELPPIGVQPATPRTLERSGESDDEINELPAIRNKSASNPIPPASGKRSAPSSAPLSHASAKPIENMVINGINGNAVKRNSIIFNSNPNEMFRGNNAQPQNELSLLSDHNIEYTQQELRKTLHMVPNVTSDAKDIKRRGNESGFFDESSDGPTKKSKRSKWEKVRSGVVNHVIRFINTSAKCKCSHIYREISNFDPTDKTDNEIIKGELSIFAQHAIDILDVISYTVKQMSESTKSPTINYPGDDSAMLTKFGHSWKPTPHRRTSLATKERGDKVQHSTTTLHSAAKKNSVSVVLPDIITQGTINKVNVNKPKRQGEITQMKAKVAEKKRLKILDRHKKLVNKLKQSGVGIKEIYTILGINNNEEVSPPIGISGGGGGGTSTGKNAGRKISLVGQGYRDNKHASPLVLNAHALHGNQHHHHEKSNRLMVGLDGARGYSRRLSVVDSKNIGQAPLGNTAIMFPSIKQPQMPTTNQPQLAVKSALKPVLFGPNVMKGRSAVSRRGVR